MPLSHYGVLKAPLLDRQLASNTSDHYQLLCSVGDDRWRVAINARSAVAPSEVAYAVISPFVHPWADRAAALADGYTALSSQTADAGGLDFVRGNLAQPDQFRALPLSLPGADNDLNDLFEFHLRPLIGDADGRVCAFGATWGPETKADQYFGFTPGRGIHDIHQNQGNVGKYVDDDGVYQDGGLLVHAAGTWTAILLRFQSQAWHTDDHTGHTIAGDGGGDHGTAGDDVVRIVAASVNPPGAAPEHETVLLLNTSYASVDLQGWTIATDAGATTLSGSVDPATVRPIDMPPTAPLSNKGGHITLLDPAGLKRHGVAYTAAQASGEQRIVVF